MTTMPQPGAPASGYAAVYDAWNRLVKLTEGANTVAEYRYDARGRRIVKKTYAAGVLSETRHFYYSAAWQIVEERVGTSSDPDLQYVWGLRYVDELVCRDRDTDANGSLDERLYALQDGNFNVTALSDTSGSIVERFSYTPYGQRTVLDAGFGLDADGLSDYGWDVGHQGLMYDDESGLIYNRYRMLHGDLGRFLQRDPLEYIDGGSLYEYVGSAPLSWLDFLGLSATFESSGDPPLWWYGLNALGQLADGVSCALNELTCGATGKVQELTGTDKFLEEDTVGAIGGTVLGNINPKGALKGAVKGGAIIVGAKACAKKADDAAAGVGKGTIYKVPGTGTPSGKPYIGRHNQPDPTKTRRSPDGRDRTQAEVVDTYDPCNTMEGRLKEQGQMDAHGGISNLDNKRNEIKK